MDDWVAFGPKNNGRLTSTPVQAQKLSFFDQAKLIAGRSNKKFPNTINDPGPWGWPLKTVVEACQAAAAAQIHFIYRKWSVLWTNYLFCKDLTWVAALIFERFKQLLISAL